MYMDHELLIRLRAIEEKLDFLSKGMEDLLAMRAVRAARKKKAKLPPPTPEEIVAHREQFATLYLRWMDGHEVDVHTELDAFDPDQLRRFADANNLNVTAKMSKDRLLELISARFREKRQLHKSPISRSGPTQ